MCDCLCVWLYYMKKTTKNNQKIQPRWMDFSFNIFYSNSSASSTASSINWLTKLRVSIRIATPIQSDTMAEYVGYPGKRYIFASSHMPRQKSMIAEPTRNASSRLFQRSSRVGFGFTWNHHFIFSNNCLIFFNCALFFWCSKKCRPSSEDSRTCRCIQDSACASFVLSASISSISSISLFLILVS